MGDLIQLEPWISYFLKSVSAFFLFKSKWLANTYNQEKPNAGRSGVFFNHLIIIYRDGQHARLRAVPACIVGANASRKTKQHSKLILQMKKMKGTISYPRSHHLKWNLSQGFGPLWPSKYEFLASIKVEAR